MIAFLDNGNNIIQTKVVSEGTVSQAVIYPRDILKEALACDCKAMILAHNHLGGSILPSNEDKAITQKLVNIFQPLDIKIHNHIIVAGVNYCSMAEKGYVPASVNGMAVYEPIKMEDKRIIEEKQSFNSELDEKLEL